MMKLNCHSALAVAALFWASTSAPAFGNDRVSFREFRAQNAGINRNTARKMFRQQSGKGARGGNGGFSVANPFEHVLTVGPNGEIICGGTINLFKRSGEPRVRNQSIQQLSNGDLTRINRGVELDLGSSNRNIVLGKGLFGSEETVEISAGGKTSTLGAGSRVTAAEYVAVKQVLAGGAQQVELDRAGKASGGTVDLGALTSGNDVMKASSLVVPKDVTTYGDFGKSSDFRLKGDLSNYGTIQALSSNGTSGGAIRADDITNHRGALISSSVDLNLHAASNLTNSGMIESSESLTLSAGGRLANSGTISSSKDLHINAANVSNKGILNSASGNVNLGTDTSADLVVNNHKGTISALSGAINLRDASYQGAADSYIKGGDLLSRELNVNSGLGTGNVYVNELTGLVSGTGTASHVIASTSALNIGTVCLTGDPVFYNTKGVINILGDVTSGEDLVFIAANSIIGVPGITIAAGDATQGYNITFISGASFTAVSGDDVSNVGPISGPPFPDSGAVTVSGKGSKTGGSIFFGADTVITSRATSNVGDLKGGQIEFFAFGKNNALIDLSTTTVLSGGQNEGANGDVLIGAEGPVGIAITNIDTSNQLIGSEGPGGDLFVSNARPQIIGGKSVSYGANGARTSFGFFSPGTKLIKNTIISLFDTVGVVDPKVNVAGNLVARSGGDLRIFVDVLATSATFEGNFVFTFGSGKVTTANSLTLETRKGGFIGAAFSAPFFAETPELIVNAPNGFASIANIHAGDMQLSTSGSRLFALTAPLATMKGGASTLTNLFLTADAFDMQNPVRSGGDVFIQSLSAPIVNASANFAGRSIFLSAPNIGVDANDPYVIDQGVTFVSAISPGDVFLQASAPKKGISILQSSAADFHFRANASIGILESITANGAIDIATTSGTIGIEDNVVVTADTLVQLTNSGAKGRIILGPNAQVSTFAKSAGLGDVIFTVGAGGGAPAQPPANVAINESGGGTVQFLGFGLTAKGAPSTINAIGANVIIDNTIGAKNILLQGNGTITADPPIDGVFTFEI